MQVHNGILSEWFRVLILCLFNYKVLITYLDKVVKKKINPAYSLCQDIGEMELEKIVSSKIIQSKGLK